MKKLAVVTRRHGTRTRETAAIEAREAARAGMAICHGLPQGTVVEGTDDAFADLAKRGFRVKVIPNARQITLNDYAIDVTQKAPAVPAELEVPAACADSWQHHLIAFDGPTNADWTAALADLGLEVAEAVSPTSVFVVGPCNLVAEAAKLPFVHWTGPFKPAYRVQKGLMEREGLIRYVRVGVYPADASDDVKAAIVEMNGTLVRATPDDGATPGRTVELIIEIGADRVAALAQVPAVRFLEYASPEPGFDGERETQIAAENLDAAAAPNTAPVTGYQNWLTTVALSGAGTTVAICDTGVDANANNNNLVAHTDLRGRQTAFIDYTGGAVTTDTDGHGTHVAGIAVGNAATGETETGAANDFLWGQGMAPGANYVTQNALFGPWPPAAFSNLTADATGAGAEVMNNSWWDLGGAGIGYTANSRTFDMLVRDPDPATPGNQSLAIVFSAGNSGPGAGTITSPKEAKNLITVGNSLTFRPGTGDVDDIRGLRNSSSRGPAVDGRILPTVCAPGTNVSAAYSRTSFRTPVAGTGSPDPMNPAQTIDQYLSISGTSMAAPHVAGGCALMIDWWRAEAGGADPSGAMLKALLINGAEDIAGGPNASGGGAIQNIPNNDQGWGRVSFENIFLQAPASDRGPRVMIDQSHAFTANGQEYRIRVAPVDPARPMRVTLVWTDAPAAAGANPALVNDLDLEVSEVAGSDVYMGNVNFQNGFSQPAGPGDTADALNNIECVYIQNPAGVYEITVIASGMQADARPPYGLVTPWQDFALVIDNAEVPAADPVSIVPVIDRSGSMISNGYVDVTRTSSRNFVDLMGIDDRLGVVSFGNAAALEYAPGGALQTIAGQPDRDAAKNAVDGIVFGGCTFMGDGIERGRDLLVAETNSRAMVLLSDGYDNKGCDQGNASKPSALDAAGALPADMPIYSCAMGPTSDQTLLEQIADITGGRYYFMPSIFDLFEIYNFIRGQVTGEGLAANESSMASASRVTGCIEAGCEHAVFTVAWFEDGVRYTPGDPKGDADISVRLRDPNGRLIPANSSVVRRTVGDGYVAFKVAEPRAGEWAIEVETARRSHTRYTAAIFVRSALSFNLDLVAEAFVVGKPIDFAASVFDRGEPVTRFRTQAAVAMPQMRVKDFLDRYADQLAKLDVPKHALADGIPDDIARLMAFQAQTLATKQVDILAPKIEPLKLEPMVQGRPTGIFTPPVVASPPLSLAPRPAPTVGSLIGGAFGGPAGAALKARAVSAVESTVGAAAVSAFNAKVNLAAATRPTAARAITLPSFGAVIDRRCVDIGKLGGATKVPGTGSPIFRGQVTNTKVPGSYNVAVSVSGIAASTGTKFCRKGLISVLVHEG